MYSKKEVLRDILALTSPTFYFLVFVRAIVGNYLPFVVELILALFFVLIFTYLLNFIGTKTSINSSLGTIVAVLTSLFYKSWLFAVMCFVLFFFTFYALKKVKNEKNLNIFAGFALGILSVILAVLFAEVLVN